MTRSEIISLVRAHARNNLHRGDGYWQWVPNATDDEIMIVVGKSRAERQVIGKCADPQYQALLSKAPNSKLAAVASIKVTPQPHVNIADVVFTVSKQTDHSDQCDIKSVTPQIATVLLELVRQYPYAPDHLQSYYRGVLKWMVRYLERFVEPRVSKAAQKEANARNIGDLRQYGWRDWDKQATKMKDPGRKTFHWEHATQGSDMIKSILALKNPTATSIAAVLETITIAWITKDENSKLTHRNRRNWMEDYKRAGIELNPSPYAPAEI